jgi:hypothetical protein
MTTARDNLSKAETVTIAAIEARSSSFAIGDHDAGERTADGPAAQLIPAKMQDGLRLSE